MKTVIIGPGALGSLFAALLAAGCDSKGHSDQDREGKRAATRQYIEYGEEPHSAAGKGIGLKVPWNDHDVWLLDRNAQRAAQIDGKLLLTMGEQEFCRFVRAGADAAAIGPADLVLLCVKSRDVAIAVTGAAPLFTPATTFIALQNGIGHLDALAQLSLPMPPALGVTAMGATLRSAGHVCHGGRGLTRIGYPAAATWEREQRLAEVAALLQRADIPTEPVPNILDFVWAKLLVNVGINALTVLHDCPNGGLLQIPEARRMLVAAVQEGQAVARALGINLPADPVSQTLEVCRATAANISSMLQDVRRGKPTEIAAINGALLAKAERLGLAAPVNRELVGRVRAIEQGYRRTVPRASCPDRL
jgi:2-dehydropantoate 2-reductase